MIGIALVSKRKLPVTAFAISCLLVAIAGHDIRSMITHSQHAPLLEHGSINLENQKYARIIRHCHAEMKFGRILLFDARGR